MELSVIVPCLNEAENIDELVTRLVSAFEDERMNCRGRAELLLVDDGSTDATWSTILRASDRHAFVVPIRHPENAGLAAAWRSATRRARGRLVCILDADLQYRPEDIAKLYEALARSGADIAQGYRSSVGRQRGARYLVSRTLHHLLNWLFSMDLADNKSGFLLCRREVFTDLLDYRGDYTYWQLFVTVAARAKRYSVCEVETTFEPRRRGRSFLSDVPIATMVRASFDVARAMIEYGVDTRRGRE